MPTEETAIIHDLSKKRFPTLSPLAKKKLIYLLLGTLTTLIVLNALIFLLPRNKKAPETFTSIAVTTTPKAFRVIKPTSLRKLTPSPQQRMLKPSATITPTSPPSLPIHQDTTFGILDTFSCQAMKGWAYDPQNPGSTVSVWAYANGDSSNGIFSGVVTANEPGTNNQSIPGNHAYTLPVIAPLKDGTSHSMYLYAELADGTKRQLANTPQVVTCNE